MAASVITVSSATEQDNVMTVSTGDGKRYKTLYLEGAKDEQNDWFLLSTYLNATELTQIVGLRGLTETSANAQAIDVVTYDSDDAKAIMTSADVGTGFLFVDYYE